MSVLAISVSECILEQDLTSTEINTSPSEMNIKVGTNMESIYQNMNQVDSKSKVFKDIQQE